MKQQILFLALISINIFGCKCSGEPDLKSSFINADFVFIGNVYAVSEVPSGFKTAHNVLSSIKIEKTYKSNYYEGFYQDNATLFGSPLRSCDILFTEKGKYLIFAYYDEDTGFLYSDNCFYTKKLKEITPAELIFVDKLSNNFKEEARIQNLKNLSADYSEDIIMDLTTPSRRINKLKKEISEIEDERRNLKIIAGILVTLTILSVSVLIISWRKRKNYRS
ncbi:hypothetical protein [Chryseobacterium sp.]|uniref:hypothetical protein n=1 Tax=Chryseobacterium sp. TaxID=1871047 RepID=UPI0011CA071E|nr:hypothetical protein [Chryseobacterium sp.]TXF78976.1 hypothetical protein FUA25_00865 [Chryseobacterium sp.]